MRGASRLLPALAAILIQGACATSPPPPAPLSSTPLPTAAPSGSAPSPSTTAGTEAPTAAELERLVCKGRSPCAIRRERRAGQDRAGRQLSVLTVYAGLDDMSGGDPSERAKADAGPPPLGIEEDERSDTLSAAQWPSPCQRFEYWLVVREPKAAPSVRLLVQACNEGHGAAGVGEDTITIGEGRLTFATMGGSNWRWSGVTVLELSPLRVQSLTSNGTWAVGPNYENTEWSWDTFSGGTTWFSPTCNDDGSLPNYEGPPGEPQKGEFVYAAIPAVEFEGNFAASGWRDTALGRCSLLIDSTEKSGFVIDGKPGDASDASLRVVASTKDELFVEITDDTWTGPSASWVKDDHLELWMGKERPGYMDHCLPKEKGEPSKAFQWGIRVADGKVFAANKRDERALTVEKSAASGGAARLKIKLPSGYTSITVAYSDSDDGKKQERLIATSKLAQAKLPTLGALKVIEKTSAVCRVENGKLEPVLLPYQGEKAVIGRD